MQATIIRVMKNNNYTCINNEFLRNKNLSLKAKGLLAVALSLPDEWDYSINGLTSILKEKRDSIKSTLDELKENNYLQINKKKNEKGLFIYEYIFKESNKINSSSRAENPELDNPGVDNPIQINKENKVKNNSKSTKKFIKPTVEEISAYIDEKNYNLDAEYFFDYYESKGWVVGKSPMKDWKASIRTWTRNKKQNNNDNNDVIW